MSKKLFGPTEAPFERKLEVDNILPLALILLEYIILQFLSSRRAGLGVRANLGSEWLVEDRQ